jgi:hypothetical protein
MSKAARAAGHWRRTGLFSAGWQSATWSANALSPNAACTGRCRLHTCTQCGPLWLECGIARPVWPCNRLPTDRSCLGAERAGVGLAAGTDAHVVFELLQGDRGSRSTSSKFRLRSATWLRKPGGERTAGANHSHAHVVLRCVGWCRNVPHAAAGTEDHVRWASGRATKR